MTPLTQLLKRSFLVGASVVGLNTCGDTYINNYYGSDAGKTADTALTDSATARVSPPETAVETQPSQCSGDLESALLEGETKAYPFTNKKYEITVSYVDADHCKFIINGDVSGKLKKGQNYTFNDGATVCVNDIDYQAYAGGVHACTFTFSGGKDVGKYDPSIIFENDAVTTSSTADTTTTTPSNTPKMNDQYTCGQLLWYPDLFVKDGIFNGYFVIGQTASALENLAMSDIANNMESKSTVCDPQTNTCKDTTFKVKVLGDAAKLDSEVANIGAQNVIAVGHPCVNYVTADLLGKVTNGSLNSNCLEGFTPGKARVMILKHKQTSNLALIVAGYSPVDTRLAAKVLAYRWKDIQSTSCEVEIEGLTYQDAVISFSTSTPTPKP